MRDVRDVKRLYLSGACSQPVSFPRPPSVPLLLGLGALGFYWRMNLGRTGTDRHAAGNPLKAGFISEPCYNLVYLELAACRLTSLPADLARLAPNLRNLNLNYNFLEDVRPLEGLTRMRKLTIIGSRVKVTKQLVKMLRGMLDVEMLDFRYVLRQPVPPWLCVCSFALLFCFALASMSLPLDGMTAFAAHLVPAPPTKL